MSTVLPNIIAKVLVFLGVVLVAAYVVFLPMPGMFQAEKVPNLGLVLYGLASAGSAFVAWGLMLGKMDENGLSKEQLLKFSAIGFALLGFMRLVTAIFPPEQFVDILFVPAGEFVMFTAIAFKLYKS